MRSREPSGIGGWLLLFVIGQAATLVVLAIATGGLPGAWSAMASLSAVPFYKTFLILEGVCQIIILIGGFVGLVMLFNRHPRTPFYYQMLLGFIIVFGILEIVGVHATYAGLAQVAADNGVSFDAPDSSRIRSYMRSARSIVVAAIWILYWRRSERVANTFAVDSGAAL